MYKIYTILSKNNLHQSVYNCVKKFTLTLFILHLVVYSFFSYLKYERKELMVVVVCEEREIIKKIKKICYFNKM